MKVKKRNGKLVEINFVKIINRIKKQTFGLDMNFIDVTKIAQKVINGLYESITTREIDAQIALVSSEYIYLHPDYNILAARILVSSLHKELEIQYSDFVKKQNLPEQENGKLKFSENFQMLSLSGVVDEKYNKIVQLNKDVLNDAIIRDRDFELDYIGYRAFEKSYLIKVNGNIQESPQFMLMRVAVGIWGENITEVLRTYEAMSLHKFTHASPTLYNSGTKRPQLSSCFLLDTEDSINGIYKTISDCAKISQYAGGIGLNIHKIRAKNSPINGTNGVTDGIVPMLKVFNETARYVNQAGRRKGAFAIYLEPWHKDIFDFIDLKKPHGKQENRARDLFLALWVNDLFMDRVQTNANWTLFSPSEVLTTLDDGSAKGLHEYYGDAFKERYEWFESQGLGKTIKAIDLWWHICDAQMESGVPYMLYKDAVNEKSNQKNLGTIQSSNLCAEVVEFTSPEETAVCNLASIGLPKFVENTGTVNKPKWVVKHTDLFETVSQIVRNLNQVIDVNFYPIPEAKTSNMRHRPIGIGVQGLSDLFAIMSIAFDSPEAKIINEEIFETIYFAALTESMNESKKYGHYSTFKGSPASNGILQFHLWKKPDGEYYTEDDLSNRWDWKTLIEDIKTHGLRNSLLTLIMPVATTSQILGNVEACEQVTSNVYKRNLLGGEFVVINKYLVRDLIKLNLWSTDMAKRLIMSEGSIQVGFDDIPHEIRERYKTMWEIKQRTILDLAADRGKFICQTQSMNVFMEDVTHKKLTSMHFYGWHLGLKTGMYYLRSRVKNGANKALGIDSSTIQPAETSAIKEGFNQMDALVCSLDNPESCEACS